MQAHLTKEQLHFFGRLQTGTEAVSIWLVWIRQARQQRGWE